MSNLFGGLSVKQEAKPPGSAAPTAGSAFSFLASTSAPAPPPPPPAPVSGFSFLSPAPAPVVTPQSAFNFLVPSQPPPPPSSAVAASASEPRKRRTTTSKRPGHARDLPEQLEAEAYMVRALPSEPVPSNSSAYGSVLAGLTVHVPAVLEEPQPVPTPPPQPQPATVVIVEEPKPDFVAQIEEIARELAALKQREQSTRGTLQALRAALERADKELEEATRGEDFDLALAVQMEMDLKRKEMEQRTSELAEIQFSLARIAKRNEDLLQAQHLEFETLVDKFDVQSRNLMNKHVALEQQTSAEELAARGALEHSESALLLQIQDAASERVAAEEEMAKVEERKAMLTADMRAERAALAMSQRELQEEILELERALQEKRGALALLDKEAQGLDGQITQAESKYAARVQEVETRLGMCQAQCDELASAKLVLDARREKLEAHCAEQARRLGDLAEQRDRAKQSAVELQELNAMATRFIEQRKLWRSTGTAAGAAVDERSSSNTALPETQALARLDEEMKTLDRVLAEESRFTQQSVALLDELETQKQLAIQLRNFKEAGRLAAEAKTLQQRRSDALGRLESGKRDVERMNAERVELVAKAELAEREMRAFARAAAQERLVVLRRARGEIAAILDKLKQSGSGSHGVALVRMLELELGEMDEDIAQWGGGVSEEEETEKEGGVAQVEEEEEPLSLQELDELLAGAIASEDFDLADAISSRIERKQQQHASLAAAAATVVHPQDDAAEEQQMVAEADEKQTGADEHAEEAIEEQPVAEEGHPVAEEQPEEDMEGPAKEAMDEPAAEAITEPAEEAMDEPAEEAMDEPAEEAMDEPSHDPLHAVVEDAAESSELEQHSAEEEPVINHSSDVEEGIALDEKQERDQNINTPYSRQDTEEQEDYVVQ